VTTYETSEAVAADELRVGVTVLSFVAAERVNGAGTGDGSDVDEIATVLEPAVELLATPSTVTTTGSPAPTLIPVVMVTAFDPDETVAPRHPCDRPNRGSAMV
jgi:hypothetical protein